MKVGDIVYTVNNVTQKVDSWVYTGALPTKDALLLRLERNGRFCHLPARCVFESEDKALAVARK